VIELRGRAVATSVIEPINRRVFLIVGEGRVAGRRSTSAYLVAPGESPPDGFPLYIGTAAPNELATELTYVQLPEALHYLSPGDILAVSADGSRLQVKWRHWSRQNSLLLTERCDHYCLMCSQPPKTAADDYLLDDAFEVVRLLPRNVPSIGFTGGEPTLHGDRLLELLRLCRSLIPDAGVHVLSNGRRFVDPAFAQAWAAIDNPNMMVGIPLYGSEPTLHDYVVQARGAFTETVRGIVNLADAGARIEIRVVVHKQTAPYLAEIAEFIARNLPFVDQVALMGLEMIGFARANIDDVWIDPIEYREALTEAVMLLDRRRIKTMIYNHQLCLIDRVVWPWAVKSISDWKNEYHPECLQCAVREACGGFFFSAKYRVSDNVAAIVEPRSPADPAMLELPAGSFGR
jgi:His-Xaa-Ser system radical SAM maturase HxsC